MSSPPLLELINATVVKGGVPVLDGLTLTIRDGEHTAILGPNGAGKSTLLNLLTHQDYAFASEQTPPVVRVFGRERWNVSDLRLHLGIISNDLHQRFVAGHSAGRVRGLDAVVSGFFATQGFLVNRDVTDTMRHDARHALARLDASHLADKTMDEMSTGEARRVLIARALVSHPKALILDEPSAGLDVVAKHRFLDAVRRIAIEGTTIVLITHHVDEIFPEIGRVLLLLGGRVVAAGPKAQMLTSASLSRLFGAPVTVDERGGYYDAHA
ncbi:MAG: ATP-binding cassette domain-containing protein [Acidobacteriaceae bacterium]|nr:ATP-binding cassette domain-containing protein [Acidobacteriaceae bacterium]